MTAKLTIILSLLLASASAVAVAAPVDVPVEFVKKASLKTGYKRSELVRIFSSSDFKPWIIEAMDKPSEASPWYVYRAKVITDVRIESGKRFVSDNLDVLSRAEERFGVPKEVIAAIIGVESSYGANKGKVRVLDALSTLSFHYPRRARFFQDELVEFLSLTKREGLDPLEVMGSYAGAMGWPQFMPTSIKRLAIDFDGDGHVDVINSPVDAIGSIGNYLKKSGWKSDQVTLTLLPPGEQGDIQLENADGTYSRLQMGGNFKAILKYNRSKMYAMAVYELSESLRN